MTGTPWRVNVFETIKACSSAIKLALMAAIAVAWWYHGHQRYNEGRAEVQALWDADKAQRKTIADKQATETAIFNQEKNDALKQTYARLSDTRSDLNAALKRLRDLSGVPRGEGVFVAVGGSSAMPGVAGNSSGTGISIEKRIGRCEDTGSDPCYADRQFFEQAIEDAVDRRLTREWATGQGIAIIKSGER